MPVIGVSDASASRMKRPSKKSDGLSVYHFGIRSSLRRGELISGFGQFECGKPFG